ncbi:taste receptor type 2 member 40-like [Hyla sarda]|uniref:taste receptor type 2 member 40-like n=1 Tax=Hyla sarda TaxID=327740 RepID=UPI0024C389A1|nr:taste receptor type 2 member 40-like [Hyla sarda]
MRTRTSVNDDKLFQNLVFITSILVISIFLNHMNLWFATILCVFYCVKITNYNHRFFIILKTRISSLVHWFLLASLTISIGCSLPFSGYVVDLGLLEFTSVSAENKTFTKVVYYKTTQNVFLVLLVGSLPPFLIFCVVIFLLIQSLWMHVRRMRSSGAGSPNLEVHFCAVKSMTLFLVLQVVYFTSMNLQMSPVLIKNWKAFTYIIICSPPFLHSLYIIFSTKKLKETFLRWFCCR